MKTSKYNIFIKSDKNVGEYLLANSLTGAVFKLSGNEKVTLDEGKIYELPEERIEEYCSKGILINDDVDEKSRLVYFHNRDKYSSDTLSLTILLTRYCNFECTYCYEGGQKINQSLTDDMRERIYRFIQTMLNLHKDMKTVSIILFGGEPLMYFEENLDWLYNIKDLCVKKGKRFITSIVTNGSLLTIERIAHLKNLNCASIQLTLDGSKKMHDERRVYKNGKGTYDVVLGAIKIICETKDFVKPTIRINIDKENIRTINELISDLNERNLLGRIFLYFGIIRDDYREKNFSELELGNELKPLWGLLRKFKCNFNIRPVRRSMFCGLFKEMSFTITPSGEVFKCWEFVGDSNFRIGSLQENGDLVPTDAYYEWQARDFKDIEECNLCKYLPICGGGCASVSKSNYGNIYSAGCLETKGIFEEQIKFYYES
nr:radical SAM protein [uncultured Acetatifactor sp.]